MPQPDIAAHATTVAQPAVQVRLIGAWMLTTALIVLAPMAFGQTAPSPTPPPTAPANKAPAEAPMPKPADVIAGQAIAQVASAEGVKIGTVSIQDTTSGVLHVTIALNGVAPGVRAVHIHTTGKCEGPQFETAGGHLTGGQKHGIASAAGPHAGDLPNIHVPESGAMTVEAFVAGTTVADVLDRDGGAFVLHAQADDYVSQPAGDAGGRIACGVFGPGA